MKFVLSGLLILSISQLYAQDYIEITDTTSFKSVIDQSISIDAGDSTQLIFADAFWSYYENQPDLKYSDWALGTAFKIWGNFGDVESIHNAMDHIAKDREIWSYIVEFIPSAYFNNSGKSQEDIIELLENLSSELTHPLAISRVYWLLSIQYSSINNQPKLIEVSQKMINLNAISVHVDIGLSHIRNLESLQNGNIAPSFDEKSINGKSIVVPSSKLILLDFWATWCSPCIEEIPTLKEIATRFPPEQLEIIGVSWDINREVVESFVEENDITWSQILQNDNTDTELNQKYGIVGIPATFLINSNGIIVARDLRGEDLINEIERLLEK